MDVIGTGLAMAACAVRDEAAGFDFGGGVLPSGAILTRASGGTHETATGSVARVGGDVARFDHAGGSRRGLLIEPEVTNLIRRSGELNQMPWSPYGLAVVRDTTVPAPDGSMDAIRVRMSGVSAQLQVLAGLSAGAMLTVSLWVRRPEGDGAPAVRITTTNTIDWNSGLSAIHSLTGAWRRIALTGVLSNGANCALCIGSIDIDGSSDPQCFGDVDLWGVQVEHGGAVTSYIPTLDAPATRSADVLNLDWGAHGVPDGEAVAGYAFDDDSGEMRPCMVTAGIAPVPVDLARRHLVSAQAI